jgi:hypothetical protein
MLIGVLLFTLEFLNSCSPSAITVISATVPTKLFERYQRLIQVSAALHFIT